MRRWLIGLAALLLLAAGFVAWPFLGLYQLGAALHAADPDAALARIDLVSLRRSLVEQVVLEAAREETVERKIGKLDKTGQQLVLRAAAAEFDRRLAGVITPEALRTLIVTGGLPDELAGALPGRSAAAPGGADRRSVGMPENPLRFLQSWRFSSPRKFKAVVGDPGRPEDWTGFSMNLNGLAWKLSEITLPPSVLARVQPLIKRKIDELRS